MPSPSLNITVAATVQRAIADLERIQRELAGVGGAAQSASAKMRASSQKMVATGKKLSLAVSLPLAAAATLSVKAASDLTEEVSKVNTVFGSSAEVLQSWAKTTADSFGISRREALEAAGAFGNMFTTVGLAQSEGSKMSKTLVELAADMASFNNQDPSDMLTRLRSGLAGEAEPLRRFGVLLSAARVEAKAMELGLADANGEISEAAKVQARYAIVLDDTTVQQGDFARTADGLANSTRRASATAEDAAASFGEVLLPITIEITKVAKVILERFASMPGPIKTVTVVLGGLAALAGPLLLLVGKMRLMSLELKRMGAEATIAGRAATGFSKALGVLGKAAGVAVAIGVVVQVTNAAADAFNRATRGAADLDKTTSALLAVAEGVGSVDAAFESANIEASSGLFKDLGAEIEEGNSGLAKALGFIPGLESGIDSLRNTFQGLDSQLAVLVQTAGPAEAQRVFDALNEKMGLNADQAALLFDDYTKAAAGADNLSRAAGLTSGELDGVAGSADAAGEAVSGFAGLTTKEFKDWSKSTAESFDPVEDAFSNLSKKAKLTTTKIIKEFTKQKAAQDNLNSNLVALVNKDVPDQLLKQLLDMGSEGAVIIETLATSNKKDLDKIVKKFQGVQREVRETQSILNAIDGTKVTAEVELRLVNYLQDTSAAVRRAHGGPVTATAPYHVGEFGPELFVPSQSGRILSKTDSERAISGGSRTNNITINVSGSTQDPRQLADTISRELARRLDRLERT